MTVALLLATTFSAAWLRTAWTGRSLGSVLNNLVLAMTLVSSRWRQPPPIFSLKLSIAVTASLPSPTFSPTTEPSAPMLSWIERPLLSVFESRSFDSIEPKLWRLPADWFKCRRLMLVWATNTCCCANRKEPLCSATVFGHGVDTARGKPSKNAAAEAEAVRVNRLREDARRPMSVNLAETIALSHALLKMADAAQRR